MSCYWGFRCRTCSSDTERCLNHGADILASIWSARVAIAQVEAAETGWLSVEVLGWYGESLSEWIATHAAHDVVIRSEYGDERDACPETGSHVEALR